MPPSFCDAAADDRCSPGAVPAAGEPLRVCDLVQFHSPISGGVKRFIEDKCRYFSDFPEVSHVVIVPGANDACERRGRSRVHVVRSPRLIGSASYRILHDQRRIEQVVVPFRPHVIEVGDPYLTAWIGRRLARRLGCRIVGFYHSDYPRAWHRTIERFFGPWAGDRFERGVTAYLRRLYTGMDALVVASRRLETHWRSRGLRSKVHFIPLGVDTAQFRPRPELRSATRAAWGLPERAPVLLYVGRLAREKRIDWLVQVHRRLLHEQPELRLVLIGDGEWRKRVSAWSRDEPRLVWQPYLGSSAALAAAFSSADVFVHAGLGETFGLSVLEAQACGCPVVACRGSGLDDTVLPLPGNACVPADDPVAWAEAICSALAAGANAAVAHERHAAVSAELPAARTHSRLRDLYALLCQPRPGRPLTTNEVAARKDVRAPGR